MADQLEDARTMALDVLVKLPPGTELFVDQAEVGRELPQLLLSLGVCVARGHAAYRGDGHWRITPNGRAYWVEQDQE